MWAVGVGLAVSPMCVSAVLLQKAYVVHGRSRLLLAIGIALILPQPVITYYLWLHPTVMDHTTACTTVYPQFFPWLKFGLDAPINVVFSVAFLIVVYRQYRLFGSGAWARLVRNGIQTMGFIVLFNFVCMFAAATEVLGLFSQMFFVMDWAVTSLLLVHHCSNLRSKTSLSNSPHVYKDAYNRAPEETIGGTYLSVHGLTTDQTAYDMESRHHFPNQ
ncbi:hypothetical protein THASP1DRAFT_24781 [Thamnocephalis sphaerospora]|uniref:Uncharacterized protein n=1 Tax=Thamnocephalis sphaerospora TaxID=78915 RepID=A0A4P9XM65_9FUNG|nr:hypothetical protein THASP1DRAFT_24781 [Thamnocephalis sphaerospora]|eukprot:RKP06993.1 hypothetical protein THASP1DRAFT_24781 [Thamnocephalis sphaerospora]